LNALRTGIYTLFNTVNDFNSAVDDLYFVEAKQNADMPFAVFHIIANDLDPYFADNPKIDTYLIQFSIFSDASGPTEAGNIFNYLNTLYDNCTLTVSGYDFVSMSREHSNLLRDPENEIWHYVVDYEIILAS